jgi:hypothetical protein
MSLAPPPLSTTRRIKRFAPLQLGKIMALIYGVMGLLFWPFILIGSLFSAHLGSQQRSGMMAFGVGFVLFIPILYAGIGFIAGVVGAFVYNVIAKWVGGIEVEVE